MRRAVLALLVLASVAADVSGKETEVLHFLPFPEGKRYQISQGNDQGPTHNDKYNRFAFDFSPYPVGTEVTASAGGVVNFVRESTEGPTGNWRENNLISIDHGDGTVSVYEHLRKDGAIVEVGDVVFSGDLIGYSGNTGNTVLPHLHFSLRKDSHMGECIPCRFQDVEGDGVPSSGDSVKSGNVAVRGSPELARIDRALELYEVAESFGCIAAALPALKAAVSVELPTRQIEFVRAGERRDALIAARDAAAADVVGSIATCRDDGDVAGALRLAMPGAKDYAGTPSEGAIKKALRELSRDPAYGDENRALQPLMKYRRQIVAAIQQLAKAESALAKVKPGKKAPSRPYRHAIAAFGRAQKTAPSEYAAAIEAYLETLPTE